MRKLSLLLPSLIILWCPITTRAQAEFSSTEVFLKSTLRSGDRVEAEARGDLNGDGLADWAAVIDRQNPETSPTYQLYVLLRLSEGGYRIAEKTNEVGVGGMGCCWVENLEIRGSSIYLQTNAKTAATMEAATHQFKLYKGQWRLIGLRIFYLDIGPDASVTTDMNFLTGSVIVKRQKGEQRPTARRRYRKFATHLLKDFDFSNGFGTE